jgi:hydroxyacylglutathione hydrolase
VTVEKSQFATMKVIAVPCLEDNYAYLVFDEETGDAAAIDPVWPDQVLQAAQLNGATVKMVLTTHHHWDHAGGNNAMKRLLKDVPVYGGVKDKVEGCTHPVEHGDEFSISPTIRVKCLETPCHTQGHISYFITCLHLEEKPAVFTGDTLFVGGCGRFFEGTPEQMYNSLCKTLASLPRETEVYCGHEYTQKNLEFALTLEPKNEALVKKMEWVMERRKQKLETVPSSIGDELEINPFMRVDQKSLQLATGRESPLEVMAEVRRMKDNYKGR